MHSNLDQQVNGTARALRRFHGMMVKFVGGYPPSATNLNSMGQKYAHLRAHMSALSSERASYRIPRFARASETRPSFPPPAAASGPRPRRRVHRQRLWRAAAPRGPRAAADGTPRRLPRGGGCRGRGGGGLGYGGVRG